MTDQVAWFAFVRTGAEPIYGCGTEEHAAEYCTRLGPQWRYDRMWPREVESANRAGEGFRIMDRLYRSEPFGPRHGLSGRPPGA